MLIGKEHGRRTTVSKQADKDSTFTQRFLSELFAYLSCLPRLEHLMSHLALACGVLALHVFNVYVPPRQPNAASRLVCPIWPEVRLLNKNARTLDLRRSCQPQGGLGTPSPSSSEPPRCPRPDPAIYPQPCTTQLHPQEVKWPF